MDLPDKNYDYQFYPKVSIYNDLVPRINSSYGVIVVVGETKSRNEVYIEFYDIRDSIKKWNVIGNIRDYNPALGQIVAIW